MNHSSPDPQSPFIRSFLRKHKICIEEIEYFEFLKKNSTLTRRNSREIKASNGSMILTLYHKNKKKQTIILSFTTTIKRVSKILQYLIRKGIPMSNAHPYHSSGNQQSTTMECRPLFRKAKTDCFTIFPACILLIGICFYSVIKHTQEYKFDALSLVCLLSGIFFSILLYFIIRRYSAFFPGATDRAVYFRHGLLRNKTTVFPYSEILKIMIDRQYNRPDLWMLELLTTDYTLHYYIFYFQEKEHVREFINSLKNDGIDAELNLD